MIASRPARPTVSVIIEGYNEAQGLGRIATTIEALKAQDFPAAEVEIILIGGPSQVKAWRTLVDAASPFWALRAMEATGPSYLLLKNDAAASASADILALTDSDVYPHRTWLTSLVAGIREGADVSIGLSLFKSATSWEWREATRVVAASITWGWIVGKTLDPARRLPIPVGFMDHNVGIRSEVFRRYPYRTDLGRLCGAPLLTRRFLDAGLRLVVQPYQRVTHSFSWTYWLKSLHFRYGCEVFMLRRLNRRYPNQWIAHTWMFEPFITLAWHILLDLPRWFRVSRLLDIPVARRVLLLPLLILLSCAARIAEAAGMCAMLAAPESMRAWAESV